MDHLARDPAQCAVAGRRAGVADGRDRDLAGIFAVIPRPRRSQPDFVGLHGRRWPHRDPAGVVDHRISGPGHPDVRARFESGRRRPQRRPQSATCKGWALNMAADPVVRIKDLRIALPPGGERAYAVDGVSCDLKPGEIVCVVGESGSGKSMCAHALMGLLPDSVVTETGEIAFDSSNLLALDEDGWRDLRGRRIAMVFQEPMTALNPLMRIGDQMTEMFEAHGLLTPRERRAKALSLAREVGLPDPERIVRAYPHQLSGGQRQRAMIAMALALEPAVLVADEPTTALDVTTQSQILKLIRNLQRNRNMAVMFITHDFGVVADIADQVVVLRHGKGVEEGPAAEGFAHPTHDYTKAPLAAGPAVHPPARAPA